MTARGARTFGVGVAGIHVPAFVERVEVEEETTGFNVCRRDSRPGLR